MSNTASAPDLALKILLALGLVLLNGFFVAAEFAFVRIRETQLEALAIRGHRRAKVARRIIANLNRTRRSYLELREAVEPLYPAQELYGIVPAESRTPYDVREVIARVVDGSGLVVLPGLINAHQHLYQGAARAIWRSDGG